MHRALWGAGVIAVGVVAAGIGLRRVGAAPAPDQPAFYTEKVAPILVSNCAKCHMGTAHKGGLSMATKQSLMKGGHDGAVIVPGDPAKSLMVKLIRHEGPADDPMPMPPKSKLSNANIATIEQWIKAGAVMPNDPPR